MSEMHYAKVSGDGDGFKLYKKASNSSPALYVIEAVTPEIYEYVKVGDLIVIVKSGAPNQQFEVLGKKVVFGFKNNSLLFIVKR